MTWLKTIVSEAYGLFVDDGAFALAILIWAAAGWLLLPRLGVPPGWHGILLFAGLALILLESTIRRARQGRHR